MGPSQNHISFHPGLIVLAFDEILNDIQTKMLASLAFRIGERHVGKSFEGLSMSDAMRAVKKEFGSNAVILSTNERIIDATGSKMIEMLAAAPEIGPMERNELHHQKYRSGRSSFNAHGRADLKHRKANGKRSAYPHARNWPTGD